MDSILSSRVLSINEGDEVKKIKDSILAALRSQLHRRGLVIGLSGGIDSSACAALSVEAVGAKKVFGLLLPESDSSPDSLRLGKQVAEKFGIQYQVQDISTTLQEVGCYRWRDEAIKSVFPQYGDGWKNKITITGGNEGKFNHFLLVVCSPEGEFFESRLGLREYLQIVSATNYKQRIRKSIEYFHADRLNYAVIGTPNRLEYDQGFFVKGGDGAADIKPIAHLYKTQVYALARHFGVPEEICKAAPTTDTYSLDQGQDEFYFSLPYDKMDMALWAYNNSISGHELAQYFGISDERAAQIYQDIEMKRKTTRYQHLQPLLVEKVEGISC